jgi:hypothetical protein
LVTDRLVYTNTQGKSIEFSADSVYYTNIRTDVKGLVSAKTTIYKEQVVGVDGAIKTGHHIESRSIEITGRIKVDLYGDVDEYARDLSAVFNPAYAGTLRFESAKTYEIDVEIEEGPDDPGNPGARYPDFKIGLLAMNPNWRLSYEKEIAIADTGTDIAYDGSKECGMEIEITANADTIDMESITITNGDEVVTITFRTGGGVYLMTDDVMKLITTPGQINILLNDEVALERIDFENTLFPFLLKPGVNVVTWAANGDEADFDVVVRYTPLYLGV